MTTAQGQAMPVSGFQGTSPLDWIEFSMSDVLPTGTVTLLLADVEGSTRLWEANATAMSDAIGRLNRVVSDLITAHRGVRPVEQGEGDSFVAAFPRASDAIACALALQRAPLAPIRLRIGVHTGEVMLRDEGNYAGPTINRTARLRDLAHGGQTVLSAVVRDLVEDALPADAWLVELGTHQLRDLPRPDHVTQLCHPDLRNAFPPLRSPNKVGTHGFPTHLTTFVGRAAALSDVRDLVMANRLVTVTGAGGAGKTRLAVRVAGEAAAAFSNGVWYVDLAPITDPQVVPATLATALGAPENPSFSTTECVARFIGGNPMLVVLDNCEHLLDPSATIASALLSACPNVTILATSREPLGVAGEVTWRVPSLSLDDEPVELFVDRARLVRPDFGVGPDNAAAVAEICRRLDGMPLAIELAAARVRALSPAELLDSLHDRFRLLTGGARAATQRQQTLRASVDWSHALLTEPERVLFRRLAAFSGGFDLAAAQFVAGEGQLERFQVLDQLTLLVDKTLLTVENRPDGTRYLLPETVRQYALEKLGESGEADAVRTRHRDHFTAMALRLDEPDATGPQRNVDRVGHELDNMRAAFAWSREHGDTELAVRLTSALQPIWSTHSRVREVLTWIAAALPDDDAEGELSTHVRARAIADQLVLNVWIGNGGDYARADIALALAREVGDAALTSHVLAACLWNAGRDATLTRRNLPEAMELACSTGNPHLLTQVLARQAHAALMVDGDPVAARRAAAQGLALADSIDDRTHSRICRWCLAMSDWLQGNIVGAEERLESVIVDCYGEGDVTWGHICAYTRSYALAFLGHTDAARAMSEATLLAAADIGELFEGLGQIGLAVAALAAGDVDEAHAASVRAWRPEVHRETVVINTAAEAALARGDLVLARTLSDEAISFMDGYHLKLALVIRARLAMEDSRYEDAEQHAHAALAESLRADSIDSLGDIFECIARAALAAGSDQEATRLLGAAAMFREHTKEVRFKVYDSTIDAAVATLRETLGDDEFDRLYEGFALTHDEAVAYARRGRGERKRPASGWASLTPAERDVVRLLAEGLQNKEIAARLFISPRTVQSHLTHVYAKLGSASRVHLAQEAARHPDS